MPQRTLAASTSFQTEMGVNPISHLDLICLPTWNGAQGDKLLGSAAAFLGALRVTWKGASLFDLTARDAMAAGFFVQGVQPQNIGTPATGNYKSFFAIRIPFGRRPYDPTECLPETKRGDLLFEVNPLALPASITSMDVIGIQHEMPGAQPGAYLRSTTLQRTPTATGDNDVDLPLGNLMVGLTMFSTTIPSLAAYTSTINQFRLLVDNKETSIASSTWFDLKTLNSFQQGPIIDSGDHVHVENIAIGYTQLASTGLPMVPTSFLANYAYADFDPDGTTQFSLDLAQPNQCQARVNCGDTNLFRLIPHNLIRLG